ncbi:MAG: protein kinase domain-containing protein, partial [Planctomycetota bacterium]
MSEDGGKAGSEHLDDDAVEEALRAAFEDEGGQSVLQSIERATGEVSRILLRDAVEDPSPVLRIHTAETPETARDDSRYQVLGEIGRGAVGVVFKARDKDLGRDVALKVLRSDLIAQPEIVQRFIEEAQIEGQLQHPGVVPLYGLGLQPDGRPYFAMKLVKGRTLSALLSARSD